MKKNILIVVVLALVGGGVFYWIKKHPDADDKAKSAEKAADEDNAGTKVSRDDKGNAVITMSDDAQGDNGINVTKVEAAQYDRELKGYGHVLDPAPLAALLNELATSQGAYIASSNELARLKTLSTQGNASARALQTGQAAALHDELAVQSAKDRIALQWGKAVAEQSDPAVFMKSLTSLKQALVRIDLPAGENGPAAPGNARIVSLAGNSVEGAFFGMATSIDPADARARLHFSRREKMVPPGLPVRQSPALSKWAASRCQERLCPAQPSCGRKVPAGLTCCRATRRTSCASRSPWTGPSIMAGS